ncbi:hypothetical protein R5R35_008792 [Gryllus longicercus]|uniref:Protein TsetseEP domain-containing protein n=1 Tax=Gryllus longicercus TaxID=2509291 RepID=A0AAN9W021_9ORTH
MVRCLVVLVAFLALQATCDAALTLSPQAWFQELVDQANSLRQQIDTTIANIEENVVNNTDAIVTKIHDDIQTVADKVRSDVESVVAKFVAAGKNIVECSERVPSEIEELITNITTSATNCVTTEVKDGESLITDLRNAGEQINATINDVQAKVAECNNHVLTAVACDVEVLASAAGTISSNSLTIFSDGAKAAALIAGFPMNVNTCEAAVFASVPAQEQALLGKVASCYTGQ